jgi:microcystin-dependent protein
MEPFIGEIILFGGNFAPKGWSLCNGQLLSIEVNAALYSILGSNYGGDGISTFGLPDLRGRVAIHPGQGVGLSRRTLGETGGAESIILKIEQMPEHNHEISTTANISVVYEITGGDHNAFNAIGAAQHKESMSPGKHPGDSGIFSTMKAGGSLPHNNMQPYQCINYIIALQGVYPART